MEQLIDPFGRKIDYLRISVTDRCNYRCVYCMPLEGVPFKDMSEILTYEEIVLFAKAAYDLGVRKIKLTGGEPLVRKHIYRLIKMLKDIGYSDISLTTNGSLLKHYAQLLKESGLNRVTVSLDTLDKDKFRSITRLGNLDDVMSGFDELDKAGFTNTKINSVIMRTYNIECIENLLNFAISRNYEIRFIEYMPTDFNENFKENFVSIDEIKSIIKNKHSLRQTSYKTNGPSQYCEIENTRVGFITPLSHNFCAFCNRIRLSSDGNLILCLGHDIKINFKDVLKQKDLEQIKELLKKSITKKPKQHQLLTTNIHQSFSNIGG
ncbi:GTP 3',8-cyclase MoaA [Desulfurella sp.]|uniref:GTP 3',8-cyclase MoaA n=1 Tax=Desulfurella sp. TaxID=1962857 RepID=UPI0025C13FC6|nr:GTP 3',8-cyclase MoaA [Desulfurella sp.]